MIVAVGVDAVAIERVRRLLRGNGTRFRQRVFTADEIAYCDGRHDPAESFAARFAAKEAVMKCLGTGWAQGVGFRDVEVRREPSGAVALLLHGDAATVAAARAVRRWHLSLSHTAHDAIAFVVAEG